MQDAHEQPADALDDEELMRQFEARTLPFRLWRHKTHVRVAWWYVTRLGFDGALVRMRSGIQAYNRANWVPDGPRMGYHETMTVVWLRIVDATIRHHGAEGSSVDLCAKHPHLLHATLPLLFYTRERILSPEAKAAFVEPDLSSLPS